MFSHGVIRIYLSIECKQRYVFFLCFNLKNML